MAVFFGCRRMHHTQKLAGAATVVVAVSMAFVCFLFSAGCKKRGQQKAVVSAEVPSVFTNRMDDAAYVQSLKTNRHEQLLKAIGVRTVETEMKAYRERVKSGLPAGADDAALESALAKDDGWQKLKERESVAQRESKQALDEARAKVRQALLDEAAAQKAVADGKAKPKDGTKPK